MLCLDYNGVLLSEFQGASCLPGMCFFQPVSLDGPWGISAAVSVVVGEVGWM